ncbi:hypothetical protein FEM08_02080 [Flavobacterium gilvum]|nr:hypothetical protein FEM08_02080 [Flavobacterium gilvum]
MNLHFLKPLVKISIKNNFLFKIGYYKTAHFFTNFTLISK